MKSRIVRGLMKITGVLPLGLCREIGRILGRTLIALDKRTNNIIKRNIEICLPNLSELEQERLRVDRLSNIGQTLFEFGHIFLKSKSAVCRYCNQLSAEHEFVKATQSDQGIVVLVPHIGNWEVMNFFLSQYRKRTILYRPVRNPELDKLFCDIRGAIGTKLVPINNSGVRQLMKSLNQKEMVVMLPDQVPNLKGGVYAPLFAEQALTMTLAHRIAKATNSKVFIGVAFQADAGFEVSIEAMANEFYSDDLQISAKALNQHIEQLILRSPAQNQWEYKRYKFGPNFMEHDLYSKNYSKTQTR